MTREKSDGVFTQEASRISTSKSSEQVEHCVFGAFSSCFIMLCLVPIGDLPDLGTGGCEGILHNLSLV